MKSEVILVGHEHAASHNLINKLISDTGIPIEYTTTVDYGQEQVSAALQQALERSSFIFVIGGMDPQKGQISKQIVSQLFDLPMSASPKLHTHISRLCALHSITMGKRITDLTLLPQGCKPVIFEGLDYGFIVPVKTGSFMVLPDSISEDSLSTCKSMLLTVAANSSRFLNHPQPKPGKQAEPPLTMLPLGAPSTLQEKRITINTRKLPKLSPKASGAIALFFILIGVLSAFGLLLFAGYLMGAGRSNPLFTWVTFRAQEPKHIVLPQPYDPDAYWVGFARYSLEEPYLDIPLPPDLVESSQEPMSSSEVSSLPSQSLATSSKPTSSSSAPSSVPQSSKPISSSAPSSSTASSSKPSSSTPSSSIPSSSVSSSSKPSSSAASSSKAPSSSAPASTEPVIVLPSEPDPSPNEDALWENQTLTINHNGSVESYNAFELICQIVQNETRGILHPEAMKAQAVAAYSYIQYNNNIGVYPAVLLNSSVSSATQKAVKAVSGLAIYHNGKIANTVYHSTSSGETTTAQSVWGKDLPYLQSVSSPLDKKSPYFSGKYSISVDSFADRVLEMMGIDLSGEPKDWIKIDYSKLEPGGYVGRVTIGGYATTQGGTLGQVAINGRLIREKLLAFGIRSTCFEVSFDGSSFVFNSKGYGHGVGMSQYGAHFYAQDEGYSYSDILRHYYTGIEIK